jgi:chemotaxis response regulator CheB
LAEYPVRSEADFTAEYSLAQEDLNLQHGRTDSCIELLEQGPRDFLVVGIGASSGGIPALSEFFRNVPADSGMAYVVILHLSPD